MRAIIQHNFSSGLGDCIMSIYQYIDTAIKLKKLGYKVDLFVNQNTNLYFHRNDFFNVFNIFVFSSIFDSIEVISENINYLAQTDKLHHIYAMNGAQPGLHWWDLFADVNNEEIKNCITEYSIYPHVSNNLPAEKNIFHSNVITSYESVACKNKYSSIYFRPKDCNDGEYLYNHFRSNIEEIIQTSKTVFVCSNSFELKKRLKEFACKNIIINDIHKEEIYGNHWGTTLTINREDSLLKTIHTIRDMLFLKDSNQIYHFSEWARISNFLFLSKLRNVPINSLYFP